MPGLLFNLIFKKMKNKPMRFRSQNVRRPDIGESNKKKSETVPNQAMGVREIMTRFANGTLPDISREIFYSEDLPDTRGLEPWQVQDMIDDNKEQIKHLQSDLKKAERLERERLSIEKDKKEELEKSKAKEDGNDK